MRTRRTRRRPALWLSALVIVAAGSAYLASNSVPATSAGDTSVGAHLYTYDDASAAITYAGTWSHTTPPPMSTAGNYNSTLSWSATSTSSATVAFTGSAVQWIGPKGPTGGKAQVLLTTAPVATVTLHATTIEYRQVLYAGTVATGHHTLEIVVTTSDVYVDAINVS